MSIVLDGSNGITVPAGAAGDEVPQAQEIGALANAQLTTHYKRSNILGTVSQSGGVPTGAIVERGSNANGNYVRFADGTQICTQTITGTVSGGTTWTFPAAFSGVPVVLATEFDTLTPRFFTASYGFTSCVLRAYTDAGISSGGNASAVAIGRWF